MLSASYYKLQTKKRLGEEEMKVIDYNKNNHWGPFSFYFGKIIDGIINFLPEKYDTILDFGSSFGALKNKLNNGKVINYDIIPECTDVKDYRTVRPDVIVCSHILEHLSRDEIIRLIKDFLLMNPQHLLITAIPTENLISKLLAFIATPLIGKSHEFHKTKIEEIQEILHNNYNLIARKNIMTMTIIEKWIPK